MLLRKESRDIQERLGAYCRTGDPVDLLAVPGLTPGRVQHYRRLVNNVVRDALDAAYPITLSALGEEQWDGLVQDFFRHGKPGSPQLWRMPLDFYTHHAAAESGDRLGLPWLDDLLYFEWMETEVYNMPDRIFPLSDPAGDLMERPLAFNPEHEIIRLAYPVHLRPVDEAATAKADYYVLIYRDTDTGYVHFLDLSPIHIYILARLMEEGEALHAIRHQVAEISGVESAAYLDEALRTFIGDLRQKGFILGTAL